MDDNGNARSTPVTLSNHLGKKLKDGDEENMKRLQGNRIRI